MKFSACILLNLCLFPPLLTVAAEDLSRPVFIIQLPDASFDYPGFEHWAEVERPDGSTEWSFAIYTGDGNWSVPISADQEGEYRLNRVERRRGESREEDALSPESQRSLRIETPLSDPHPPMAREPLVAAGEFTTFYAAEEPWCVNDHTFVQGPGGTWHLYGITHPKPLSWEKDPGRQLAHATAGSLLQTPWEGQPFAVRRNLDDHNEYLLWAPYVLAHAGRYFMYVCVGDPANHARYRIHLLTSDDLRHWSRSASNPMVEDGFDARDPFVMRVGEQWVMYYTATSTPECGNHVIACVTSSDLTHWGRRQVVFTHPRAGSFGGPTESPFIVQRGDLYYLFVCDNEWTDVYVSKDPFHWEFDQKNTRIRAHAAEVVRDVDGNWYMSHAGWTSGPLKMAPLAWHDGLDDAPTNIQPANDPD